MSGRSRFKTFKCCGLFDPDSFQFCDGLYTSGAEAQKKQWAVSRNHVRCFSGRNLVRFIQARYVMLNVRARIRSKCNNEDAEAVDLNATFEAIIPCSCQRYLLMKEKEAQEELEME